MMEGMTHCLEGINHLMQCMDIQNENLRMVGAATGVDIDSFTPFLEPPTYFRDMQAQ